MSWILEYHLRVVQLVHVHARNLSVKCKNITFTQNDKLHVQNIILSKDNNVRVL